MWAARALLVTAAVLVVTTTHCAAAALAACAHGETVSPVSGLCACLPGYTGADCSQEVHPACSAVFTHDDVAPTTAAAAAPRVLPPAMHCMPLGVASCECLRQCHALPTRGWTDLQASCYERRGAASPLNAADANVTFFSNWREPREAMSAAAALKTYDGRRLLPLSRCPRSCSGDGACLDEPKTVCRCGSGLSGAACETPDPAACFRACSGRGECVRGVCVCTAGWFGMGCTEEVAVVQAIVRAVNASNASSPSLGDVRHKLAIHV
jgi:hypothetical protein